MTTATAASTVGQRLDKNGWYGAAPAEVAMRLGVDSAAGLTSQQAAELLQQHGPNALPAEASILGWKTFLRQYRTYMPIDPGGGDRLAGHQGVEYRRAAPAGHRAQRRSGVAAGG